jgi:glycine dehydrogenase subunit 1
MRYIPHTERDIKEMLARIGVARVEDLFASIPKSLRLEKPLNLPGALSEPEVVQTLRRLQKHNLDPEEYTQFLGAGAYRHYTPSLINHLTLRGEFMTSYTPYQPEVSQGTLQAIFEFQSMITLLTGMEIANASMYDGASALAEAVLMANRINQKEEILIARAVHPEYRETVATYNLGKKLKLIEIPYRADGKTDLEFVYAHLSDRTSAVVLQSPNFFGVVEEYASLAKKLKTVGALLVVAVAEPISLGILKPPGERGADIVVGEGQGFGLPVSYGGPYVGFFAGREKQFRQMPGRLIGKTVDQQGRTAFTLTLSTREQHIRREKATSNICTNQGLCALAATIYLSVLGKSGMRETAVQNVRKSEYLKNKLEKLPGWKIKFSADTFNEFVLQCPQPAESVRDKLIQHKILAGAPLGRHYPELADCLLLCVTETNTVEEMDRLTDKLAAI